MKFFGFQSKESAAAAIEALGLDATYSHGEEHHAIKASIISEGPKAGIYITGSAMPVAPGSGGIIELVSGSRALVASVERDELDVIRLRTVELPVTVPEEALQ
jgi:hypothetical protein